MMTREMDDGNPLLSLPGPRHYMARLVYNVEGMWNRNYESKQGQLKPDPTMSFLSFFPGSD